MDPLTLAFACAVQLSGIPDHGGPLPHWEARDLTAAERLLTNRPRNARAMYDYRTITIVSPAALRRSISATKPDKTVGRSRFFKVATSPAANASTIRVKAARAPAMKRFSSKAGSSARTWAIAPASDPCGTVSFTSMATPSIVPAVLAAADGAIASLKMVAVSTPGSPFLNQNPDNLAFENGRVFAKADGPAKGLPFADVLRRANLRIVSGDGQSPATFGNPKPKFSTQSFGAHFVEVTALSVTV